MARFIPLLQKSPRDPQADRPRSPVLPLCADPRVSHRPRRRSACMPDTVSKELLCESSGRELRGKRSEEPSGRNRSSNDIISPRSVGSGATSSSQSPEPSSRSTYQNIAWAEVDPAVAAHRSLSTHQLANLFRTRLPPMMMPTLDQSTPSRVIATSEPSRTASDQPVAMSELRLSTPSHEIATFERSESKSSAKNMATSQRSKSKSSAQKMASLILVEEPKADSGAVDASSAKRWRNARRLTSQLKQLTSQLSASDDEEPEAPQEQLVPELEDASHKVDKRAKHWKRLYALATSLPEDGPSDENILPPDPVAPSGGFFDVFRCKGG